MPETITPNLGMLWPPHGAANWDTQVISNSEIVDNVFGIPTCGDSSHAVGWDSFQKKLTCQSITGAGGVQLAPIADQIITGAHALTLSDQGSTLSAQGSAQFGSPVTGSSAVNWSSNFNLNANPTGTAFIQDTYNAIQENVKYSPSGDASSEDVLGQFVSVFVDSTNTHNIDGIGALRFRAAADGSGTINGVTGIDGLAVTQGSSHVTGALYGVAGEIVIEGTGNVDDPSPALWGHVENDGNGNFADARVAWLDSPEFNAGTGQLTHFYSLYISNPAVGGARNPDPHGIFIEGSAPNNLGAGVTTVGSLQGPVGASPATPNTGIFSSLTLGAITGSVQCLHVNSSGLVSGTGADCGSGGGGGVSSVSGTANQLTVVNGSTTPTVSIPSTFTFPGTVTNGLGIFGSASTSSAQLLGLITDETGTGVVMGNNSPTIITPTIASFANAPHNHTNAAGGGTLSLTTGAFPNQGSTVTVLHGNASGNPSFSSVVNNDIANATIDLTAKVTGLLPIANGGTGTLSPGLVAGTNITITGSWPNQTINTSAGGTVTHTTGSLTANALVVGNGTGDTKVLGSLGTTTTLLHGNAAGLPTFSGVGIADLTATGTPSISTVLCGNNTWCTPSGTGTVTTTGSPASTQVSLMSGTTSITGDSTLTFNSTSKMLTANYLGSKTGPWIDPTAWGADPTGATDSTTAWQNAVNQMEASGGAIICKGNFKLNRVQLAGADTIRGVGDQGNKGCAIAPVTDAAFVSKTPTNGAVGPFTITDIEFVGGTNVIDFGVGGVGIKIERCDFNEYTGCAVMIGTAEQVQFNNISSFHDTAVGTALLCTGNYSRSLFSGVLPGTDGGIARITAINLFENGSIGGDGGSVGSLVLAEGEGWGEADAAKWTCFFSCTTQVAQFGNNTGNDAFVDGSSLRGVTTDHIGPGGGVNAAYVLRFAGNLNDSSVSEVTPCFNGQQATIQMYVEVMTNSTLSNNYFCNAAQGADNVTTFGLKFGNHGGTRGQILSTRGAIYAPGILTENGLSISGSYLKPTTLPAGGQITDQTNTGIQMVLENTVGSVNDTATTAPFTVTRGVGDGATYTTDFTSDGSKLTLNENLAFSKILIAKATPTISSGFGTSPSVSGSNGSATFRVNVGTGGTATNGVIAMNATATTGWNCAVNNLTASAGHRADNTQQTASSTTTVTIENQTKSTGAAVAWTASDSIVLTCTAF